MPIGLYLPQDLDPERAIGIAKTAEACGLDSAWLPDHLHQFPDKTRGRLEAWTTLSAVAVETGRIRLGLGVCNVQLRNARLLAKMAFTVDSISGGRLSLALGTGGNGPEIRAYGYPTLNGPQAREVLGQVVRAIKSEHYRNPGPTQSPFPLAVAADHKATMRIVAQEADWWYANLATAEQFADRNAQMTDVCRIENRDPATLRRNAHVLVILGETKDEAASAAERYAAKPRARLFETPHVIGGAKEVGLALRRYRDAGADRACVYVLNINEHNGKAAESLVHVLGEAAQLTR